MKVCDRCASTNVTRSYFEQAQGQEIDLCTSCNEGLEVWMKSDVKPQTPDDRIQETKKRKEK